MHGHDLFARMTASNPQAYACAAEEDLSTALDRLKRMRDFIASKFALVLSFSAALAQAAPPGGAREEASAIRDLHTALDRWIQATNQRDFDGQAQFYPARMEAFYLQREVSKSAVLAEKRRVFDRAQHIAIEIEDPQIIIESDGQRARMYFRKTYEIRTGRTGREGEVLQELRWIKQNDGWKIVSERDIYVID